MNKVNISVNRFTSFAAARKAAHGALDGDVQPTAFDRLDWFEALHASAFPTAQPLILRACNGQGAAWLFLVNQGERHYASLSNWYSFTYGPQRSGMVRGDHVAALITAIAQDLRHDVARLRLHPIVDEDNGMTSRFVETWRAGGWRAISRPMGRKRIIHLPADANFADFWAQRPGALRSTLARKARRHPLAIQIHRAVSHALWNDFRAVFTASWKKSGDDFAFLHAFAEREAHAGRLRLGIARDRSGPVAAELWTIDKGAAYIHKLAFDERAADASPGTQLSHAMFAYAIDRDMARTIDFGTGDTPYKANWIPYSVPLLQVDLFDMRRPANWLPALATAISAHMPPPRDPSAVKRTMGSRRDALAVRRDG